MPSTRMSLTTNGSRASARVAIKPATRAGTSFSGMYCSSSYVLSAGRAPNWCSWALAENARQQTEQVVVQRQGHQRSEEKHPRLLTHLQGTVRERTALDDLDRIIQQVPSIQ